MIERETVLMVPALESVGVGGEPNATLYPLLFGERRDAMPRVRAFAAAWRRLRQSRDVTAADFARLCDLGMVLPAAGCAGKE